MVTTAAGDKFAHSDQVLCSPALSIFGFGQNIFECGFVGIFPPPRKDTIANVKNARKYSQGKVKVLKFAVILAHKLVLAC